MNVRLNSITTVPSWLNPIVFTATIPTFGRDFDSRFESACSCGDVYIRPLFLEYARHQEQDIFLIVNDQGRRSVNHFSQGDS